MTEAVSQDARRLMSEFRARTGMSQTECARRVRIRQSTWSEIENDKKDPHLKTASRICDLIGAPFEAWRGKGREWRLQR